MRPNVERLLDLNEIAIFSCVAEEGSLTRAARRLGLPKSTVSRKLTALEERLRARLLHRTPRRVELTEAGRALHVEARTALAQLGDAAERVSDQGDALRGKVRVAAPNDFGVAVCSPLFCDFARRHPEITLDVSLSDHTVDLVHDGFDVAIRVGPIADPSLVARQVGAIRGHLVASPEYAASRPMPRTPEELADHPFVEFAPNLARHGFVRLFSKGGAMLDVPVRAAIRANSVAVVREAVLGGLGIARLPTYMSSKLEASGKLTRVLTDHWTGERTVHLVHTGRRLLPARVKLLLDFLATELSATVA